MFSRNQNRTLAALSEGELLHRIRQWLGSTCPPPPFGIGDDTAVLPPTGGLPVLLANDAVVLNRHFTRRDSPHAVGSKLLNRCLSDIAAMGGSPLYAIIQLISPPNLSLEWLRQFYEGIADTARPHSVGIVGGDCTTAPSQMFAASLSITGTALRPVPRGAAGPGDQIMVSGELGGSILGHHLSFQPRLDAGQWLARQPEVVTMIDITDGIAKDLPELLSSDSAACLNPDTIPISAAARTLARQTGQTPLYHALCDGEDYELLFAVRTDSPADFIARWNTNPAFPKLSHIGSVVQRNDPASPAIIAPNGLLFTGITGFEAYRSQHSRQTPAAG